MPRNPASSRRALPAAVSTLVAELVHGPPVDATVIGVHRYAVYLAVGGSVLPVVTADAVPLPTAVRLAVPSGSVAWGVGVGRPVRVGGGRVELVGLDVVAARTWRPARVRRQVPAPLTPRGECASGCHDHRFRTHGELGAASGEAGDDSRGSAWLADGIRDVCSAAAPRGECGSGCQSDHFRTHGEVAAAVAGLVGRGAGLTPSGDDALAGALLVAHALGTGTALADAVRARLGATTAVSAALLDAAADGYAARPVVTLVDAAVANDPDAVARALPAVLAIGHTSGTDTVTGIRVALDAIIPRVECGSGCRDDHCRTHGGTTNGRRAA